MNILESILSTQGGAIVKQIAGQLGLNQAQVQTAIKVLAPIVVGAIAQNLGRGGGLDSLLGALKGGNHGRYVDDSSILSQAVTTDDGNGILKNIFGDKEVSREAASRASGSTGINSSILKKLLPVLATVVMGGLSKQATSDGILGSATQSSGSARTGNASDGLMSILNPVLDQNQDGSALDDILRMATRYLGK